MYLLLLSWFIPHFNSEIHINKNGSLKITEKIQVDFDRGYYHGIYREIPLELRGKMGDYSLGFNVEEVLLDGKEVPLRKSSESRGGQKYLVLRIGNPNITITGKHLYTIEYSVLLGFRYFETWDELYWNVTGNEWKAPIDSTSCTIVFPQPVQLTQNDIKVLRGAYGTADEIETYRIEREFLQISGSRLNPGEGITIAAKFPKGVIDKPSGIKIGWFWFKNNFGFLIPLIFFGFLFTRWFRTGRDKTPGPVMVRYKAPEDLSAAESGTLFDQRVDPVDCSSILFDLAKKGYIEIEEVEREIFLALKRKDYKIIVINEMSDTLPEHQKIFLEGLLSKGGKEFLLSKLKGSFYTEISRVKKSLYKSMNKKRLFYGNPENIRNKYLFGGFGLLFLGFNLIIISIIFLGFLGSAVKTGSGILISGLLTMIFAAVMPKRSPYGNKKYTEVLGFREFLTRVEKERLERMLDSNPNIFFDFLSYAISLGVVDEWAERFRGLSIEVPSWYRAGNLSGMTSATMISENLSDTISAMSTSMSPPRGSSSGFSGGGGGFSGGGGGGGGGGAW